MPLANFRFGPTAPVAFGIDRLDRLGRDVAALAGTAAPVLVVADPGVAAAGLVDRVESALRKDGLALEVFADVRSDPLGAQVDAAAERARALGAACVVGVGGGSALDVAKLAAAVAPAGRPTAHYALAANPLPVRGLAKVCLPTTAGTGSETTRTSVFTDAEGRKVWAWGEPLRADLALLDPRLTTGLPPHLAAATGIDALVHAIEACTVRRANPFDDAVCLQAVRLITANLARAVEAPDDLEARGGMQIAAALAGIAIDNSGTGVAHAMGHALGMIGHVHHGRAVGLCLRAALPWNAEADPVRHAAVAEAMGVPAEGWSVEALATELAPAFDRFIRSVGLPVSLAADGLSAADARRLAEAAMAPENKPMRDANIRAIAPADAERIAAAVLSAA